MNAANRKLSPSRRTTATLLALAGLVGLAPPGCVLTERRPETPPVPSPGALGGAQPPLTKTDFHRDATPSQQYNVHMELGRVYESQGNLEAAVAEYQKASDAAAQKGSFRSGQRLGPADQALAQRRMGAAFDRLGRFAQAETHYQQSMALSPRDARTWNDLGYSYYLQNRWPDAERTLKTADSMEPNNARVLTNLGLVLAAQGKDDEALASLSRASGPAVGHANLGFILAAMGKTAEARRHYESALSIQPEMNAARVAISHIDKPSAPGNAVQLAAGPAAAAPATPSDTLPRAGGTLDVTHVSPKPAASDTGITRASAVSNTSGVLPTLPPRSTPRG
jgi:Flp pilus assembly protein TadD